MDSNEASCSSIRLIRHHLIIGSLSGCLAIVDVASQTEVRHFNLAPIVGLQLCKYHCQEWLLIETTAEPKHWKLLLATTIERPAWKSSDGAEPRKLEWTITEGQALPTSSSEHFELEPLTGMPTLYMLLVVKRGRSEAVLERENEVLGMLVDEADPADGGDHQLSMLLSLPSFPEDPLARVDLPISAAPPSAAGRRLVDLVLILGGGLFLSVLHLGGAESKSLVLLTTAKPQPYFAARSGPVNIVVQELEVPGRIVGASSAYPSWSGEDGRETTLAFVWTMNEVFRLSASPEKVCELLQSESVAALPAMLTQEADAAEPPEIQEGIPHEVPRMDLEAVLPLLCWALD
ncbi:unnamed protein product, partial [Symbiodinium necroappetens]